MKKILTLQWIPCEERLPDNNDYIMLSFENYSLPEIGRYEENLEGGAFYIGNENITCISKGFFVNAWTPLPMPYIKER